MAEHVVAGNNNTLPPADLSVPGDKKTWIKFEEGQQNGTPTSPSVHVNIPADSHPLQQNQVNGPSEEEDHGKSLSPPLPDDAAVLQLPPPPSTPSRPQTLPLAQNTAILETSTRQHYSESPVTAPAQHQHGFANGDILVTLLPLNTRCPWVTRAIFKPELVPEELMAPGLTLTVEDYVMAMQMLVNDVRFNIYIVLYKRVLLFWILIGFFILLFLLFSGAKGLALFGGGIVWLILNAVGIFACMWIKVKLYRQLEQCIAGVNAHLIKHRILIGLDDKGKLSCHKINLIFVFFDSSYCLKFLKDMIDNSESTEAQETTTAATAANKTLNPDRMDIDRSDIIITGTSNTRLSQKEKYAERLLLRYSQRWVKEFTRHRLGLHLPLHPTGLEETSNPLPPRHCATARCPCQYIDEHLRFKPANRFSIRELFS